ncbi:hypothetical protein CLCR_11220 [Cladophialophora carrionii]|uniref:Uncharacterized protein n=1 Tax=Cladophialophora carrionii TaxID=86049 RepID=A0A1C1C6U6_9EURO|nr:hypothetical protein CLCR_11220 [Cladophialophora carrionii]
MMRPAARKETREWKHAVRNKMPLRHIANFVPSFANSALSPTVTWAQAHALPYFKACLLVAMRMTPAVGVSIPQSVPKGGPRTEGKYYPRGIAASVNGWAVHRDKLFEDHVLVFRPEPWLPGDVMDTTQVYISIEKL